MTKKNTHKAYKEREGNIALVMYRSNRGSLPATGTTDMRVGYAESGQGGEILLLGGHTDSPKRFETGRADSAQSSPTTEKGVKAA